MANLLVFFFKSEDNLLEKKVLCNSVRFGEKTYKKLISSKTSYLIQILT